MMLLEAEGEAVVQRAAAVEEEAAEVRNQAREAAEVEMVPKKAAEVEVAEAKAESLMAS